MSRDGTGPSSDRTASGVIADVTYIGSSTRLVVALDAGKRITVLEQNSAGTLSANERGTRVTVGWQEADTVVLSTAAPALQPTH